MESGIVCALLVGAIARCFSVIAKVIIQVGAIYVLTVIYVQILTKQSIAAQIIHRWQQFRRTSNEGSADKPKEGLRKWVATAQTANGQDVKVTSENALPELAVSVQSKPILI